MARLGRRYPVQPVIRKLTPVIAAANAPVPPPQVQFRAAVANSLHRQHMLRFLGTNVVEPVVVIPIPRIRPKIKIQHDEKLENARSRKHEQQVSKLINALARSGELIDSLSDPKIGYLPADPTAVGTTEVLALKDVLDRIIAALKANGIGI